MGIISLAHGRNTIYEFNNPLLVEDSVGRGCCAGLGPTFDDSLLKGSNARKLSYPGSSNFFPSIQTEVQARGWKHSRTLLSSPSTSMLSTAHD